MRNVAKTLKQFLNGFEIPAYTTLTVPDDVELPYITYPLVQPEWDQKTSFYIQGWYRTTTYDDMLAKADRIMGEIGTGLKLRMNGGYMVLYPETPFFQLVPSEEDNDVRSFYLNLSINAYQMPGV